MHNSDLVIPLPLSEHAWLNRQIGDDAMILDSYDDHVEVMGELAQVGRA
jgi:hypothetical protein